MYVKRNLFQKHKFYITNVLVGPLTQRLLRNKTLIKKVCKEYRKAVKSKKVNDWKEKIK